jgi:cytochrome P450
VAELEPRIRELTRDHLDVALQRGSFDLVGDLAGKLPMDVISELIGVPSVDRDELRRLSDLLGPGVVGVDAVPPAGVEAAYSLIGYYPYMLAPRRARRPDDLTSALLDAEIDGDRLTDEEIIGFLFLMVVAGNETTTKLLGHAWWWSWRFPDERAKVLGNPTRDGVERWVEETLRFDTSSQMLARITLEAVELHGQVIPAGERVLLLAGSANRDPAVFEDPDRYDLDREVGPDLASFGFGRHFCMGASLARMEARVALEQIAERVTGWEVDEAGAARVHSVNVRGFATLPSTVDVRPTTVGVR